MKPEPCTLITSLLEALQLLRVRWGARATAEFHLPASWAKEDQIWSKPRIVREYFTGQYDSYSGTDEWPVTKEVADQLMSLTVGKPKWGYTEEKERTPTRRAWDKLAELEKEINTGEEL